MEEGNKKVAVAGHISLDCFSRESCLRWEKP